MAEGELTGRDYLLKKCVIDLTVLDVVYEKQKHALFETASAFVCQWFFFYALNNLPAYPSK